MTTGIAGMLHPSLAAMVDAVALKINREALHERFTESAVAFMAKCANYVLHQKINSMTFIHSKLLNHFKRIFIFDSTAWDLNPSLKEAFPGHKGHASSACCKVQLCYEYLRGIISFFDIIPGNMPDNKYTFYLPNLLRPKDLLIMDLGYFCLDTFRRINEAGAYFISRFLIGTNLYDAQTNIQIDLYNVLKNIRESVYEVLVIMGEKSRTSVQCRLICLRVNNDIAQQRRRKLKEKAHRKGKTFSKEYLFFADWIIMITNVPQCWLPSEMVRPFYSLRWQIELLFKQIKSVLAIHHIHTRNKNRLCCEVLGKLIICILIHKIHANLNIRLWNSQQQEISFDKIYKRIQERLFIITELLVRSVHKALIYLQQEIDKLLINCRKIKQKFRQSTLEFLEVAQNELYKAA